MVTISSISAVCSALVVLCSMNIACVCSAINFATKSDSGVSTTTRSAMRQSSTIMNASVPRIVMTPVKNCVKPIKRPSEKVSTSEITRLTVSPAGCASIYESGSAWILRMASRRMSCTTL